MGDGRPTTAAEGCGWNRDVVVLWPGAEQKVWPEEEHPTWPQNTLSADCFFCRSKLALLPGRPWAAKGPNSIRHHHFFCSNAEIRVCPIFVSFDEQ